MANEYNFFGGSSNDSGNQILGFWGTGVLSVGDSGGSSFDGAVRFVNVAIPQGATVISAGLNFYIDNKGSGTGDLKYAVRGIKETNTSDFSGGNPFGRTMTTAQTLATQTLGAIGTGFGCDVTAIVNEIVGQGGWVSGNAMGFEVLNNGSATSVYIDNDWHGGTTHDAYLNVLLVTRPNFYPSPQSINTPIQPQSKSDYGIKIAKKNFSATTINQKQLIIDNSPVLKAVKSGLTNVPSGSINVATNLGYKGAFLAYGQIPGGYRTKFPAYNLGSSSPGAATIDGTNLKLYSSSGAEVYYYIFIDDIKL